MVWKLHPKDARWYINLLFGAVMIAWIASIAIEIRNYKSVSSKLSKERSVVLSSLYKNEATINPDVTFEQFEQLKKDSVENAILADMASSGLRSKVSSYQTSVNNWFNVIAIWVFITMGIVVLFEYLKAPFHLREKMNEIDRKMDLILINTEVIKLNMMVDERLPELEDEELI
jgi:hypothetical protein